MTDFLRVLFFAALALTATPPLTADPPKEKPANDQERRTNRLARETSPYLLQHAHNPVDWYPWGEEAFAKAKKEGKLVFLSIGYSSCFWCHVMERESFENPEVAKLLNDWFVCIKVDREERPDIDHIYMTALHCMRQRGGWPLSMFLMTDGKPIVGGTYWPADDKKLDDGSTMRGFKSILKIVHDLQTTKPKEIADNATKIAVVTQEALLMSIPGAALITRDRALVQQAVKAVREEFDPVHGGFGSPAREFRGTKFPTPPYLDLLLYEWERANDNESGTVVTLTLDRMAQGGIFDQLGGGFHRYSTERTWTIPHFEKMLYDNAQLAEVYARAYRKTKSLLYRRVLEETLAYVQRDMTAPGGAFYSALDAETHGEEGRFYVWTEKELLAALPDADELRLARMIYGAEKEPNFEGKYHILTRRGNDGTQAKELKLTSEQFAGKVAAIRSKLLGVRAKRERPLLDTKILAAWNGQMIAGYVAAGQALENKQFVERAARAADFVLKQMRTKDGRLFRTYGIPAGAKDGEAKLNGYLDDYAYLVHGLLALHEATQEARWLTEARTLTDRMIELFSDPKEGGFFYTSHDHEKLFARAKDQHDGAQPSANSVAARNLVRLWLKTGDDRYRDLAEKTFTTFAPALKSYPTSVTYLTGSLGILLDTKEKKQAQTTEKKP